MAACRAVLPDWVKVMMAEALICLAKLKAAQLTASGIDFSLISLSRKAHVSKGKPDSASEAIRFMVAMAFTGYFHTAVSSDSMTASVLSRMALTTAVTSARVGRGQPSTSTFEWL